MSRKQVYKVTGKYGGQRNPLSADFETSNEEVFRKHCRHIIRFGTNNHDISCWTPESERVYKEELEN